MAGRVIGELVKKRAAAHGEVFSGVIGEVRVMLLHSRTRADGVEVWQMAVGEPGRRGMSTRARRSQGHGAPSAIIASSTSTRSWAAMFRSSSSRAAQSAVGSASAINNR